MNRFLKLPMNEEELIENHNICALIYAKLNESLQLGKNNEAIKLNRMIYEKVFDRYLYELKQNKFRESECLHGLAEDAKKLIIQLNHWEETA